MRPVAPGRCGQQCSPGFWVSGFLCWEEGPLAGCHICGSELHELLHCGAGFVSKWDKPKPGQVHRGDPVRTRTAGAQCVLLSDGAFGSLELVCAGV